MTRNNPSHNTPLSPKLPAVIQNSQTAVASIGNPMAILNFSIHAPGFGRNFSSAGFQLSSTYGNASPNPAAMKAKAVTTGGCVNPNASAPVRNGAVQGVARMVARMPLKNAPP